jgi:hypothetical protein
LARLHLRVQRFEQSEAVERLERFERASVLNIAPIRDVATSTLPVLRAQIRPGSIFIINFTHAREIRGPVLPIDD